MKLSLDEFDIDFAEISNALFKISPTLNVDFFLELLHKGKIVHKKKDTTLYDINSQDKNLYLILDGYIRLLKPDANGVDKTVFIFEKHEILICLHSTILDTPSIYDAECITDCVIFQIDYTSLEKKMLSTPKTSKIFTDNIFKFMLNLLDHINQLTLLTYEERFEWFVENKRDFLKDLPSKHIASFLGISSASLARIKRKYYKNE